MEAELGIHEAQHWSILTYKDLVILNCPTAEIVTEGKLLAIIMKPKPEWEQKEVVDLVWRHFTHHTMRFCIIFPSSCHRVPFQLFWNSGGWEFLLYQPISCAEPKNNSCAVSYRGIYNQRNPLQSGCSSCTAKTGFYSYCREQLCGQRKSGWRAFSAYS